MAKPIWGSTDVTRVALSDGEWIEFKDQTTVRDIKRIRRELAQDRSPSGEDDPVLFRMAYILARIADWSFRDREGRPVPVTLDAFDALSSDMAREIGDALDRIVTAEDVEKNVTTGETSDAPTSPSAS